MKLNIRKIFNRGANHPKKVLEGVSIPFKTERDWHIILALFAVIAISSAFAHYTYYLSVIKEDVYVDEVNAEPVLSSKYEEGIQTLKDKAVRHQYLLENKPQVISPN